MGKGKTMSTQRMAIVTVVLLIVAGLALGQAEEAKAPKLTVDAKLCTKVENLMPVGVATSFTADVGKVYLWTKVMGSDGETSIKHEWFHDGNEMAVVDLAVKSASWRTYSSKTIPEDQTGSWEVKVVDAQGNTLASVPFTVGEAMEKPATPEPPKTPAPKAEPESPAPKPETSPAPKPETPPAPKPETPPAPEGE
jgi:hypothetical protein